MTGHAYVYLGDRMTDESLRNQPCVGVLRPDGKHVVSTKMASALVTFGGEARPRVVMRRMLRRVNACICCGSPVELRREYAPGHRRVCKCCAVCKCGSRKPPALCHGISPSNRKVPLVSPQAIPRR